MLRKLASRTLRMLGWTIQGRPPVELAKAVMIVMPHTSNWDFPLGLMVRWALGLQVQFIGKHTLFHPPFGWFFRFLGGHPVDRRQPNSLVDQIVQLFDRHERFLLAITPEGTRKKVSRIRSGFYHIALGAQVPIVMVQFDYRLKAVAFAEPFWPSGDKDEDMQYILDHYRHVAGKHPELGLDENVTFK